MKVTFLGTGTSQGVPIIGCSCEVCTSSNSKDNRLRTSIHLQSQSTSLVIDTGPDFRQQMLRYNIKSLDGVVFTHEHKDHTSGLDDIRAFNFLQKKKIPLYLTQRVQEAIKMEFSYIFATEKYPGIPEVDLVNIDTQPFFVGDIELIPIKVKHMKLPVLGFRINDFTYITDANSIDDSEKEKIKGTKILVLNALRHEKHPSHYTLQEALELVAELKPEIAYFTHISHQLGLHNNVQRTLPKNIQLAYDGLCIDI
ncbi:MAG: MBL fold metallo-hydrolase [Bacteroidetes bacterium]|nr:MBL fold metallo-hydrolase [Bacteroidota bacterium]